MGACEWAASTAPPRAACHGKRFAPCVRLHAFFQTGRTKQGLALGIHKDVANFLSSVPTSDVIGAVEENPARLLWSDLDGVPRPWEHHG